MSRPLPLVVLHPMRPLRSIFRISRDGRGPAWPSSFVAATVALAFAVTALALAGPARAAEVQFVAPGVAGSVTGVVVGGQTYDVTFEGRVTHQQWASQLDFTNEDDAEAAAQALADALNTAEATAMRFQTPSGTFDHNNAVTWYAADSTSLYGENTLRSGASWILGNPLPGGATAPLNTARPLAADWTLAQPPAPVPLAHPLVQVGLAALLAISGALQAARRLD